CQQFDTPLEQRLVVQQMVDEVAKIDPDFIRLAEEPIPLEETLEYQTFEAFHGISPRGGNAAFIEEFDRELGPRTSKLIDAPQQAEQTMAQAVRSVLGLVRERLSDAQAIRLVLDPAKNPYLSDALTLTTLSKLSRTMVHPHFTFRRKLSHTADSQDQRHRMVPGSRPILACHFISDRPDYILPALVAAVSEARESYEETMSLTWNAISELLDLGVSLADALYLLPNAFPIRFEESGDLLHWHHKWVQRLCYTAQEEIWSACQDEVLQVKERYPEIGQYLQAPCWVRFKAGVRPHCPEGDRFCGIAVWKMPVEFYRRLI
ncbi:MAG: FAD-dependent thymidylate synthase, partial [Candidatus Omnitrophica bacterium]|nr:FAD-dependent thymidylate synthase [Candidatus Omnitrophota bacterium]